MRIFFQAILIVLRAFIRGIVILIRRCGGMLVVFKGGLISCVDFFRQGKVVYLNVH